MSEDSAQPINVPADALVLLIGAAGSGKSTFARRHFPADAIVSSDAFRGLLTGDASDQRATEAAFELLHRAVERRLQVGLLTVVDATNVDWMSRAPLLHLSHGYRRPVVAVVLALSLEVCLARNAARPRPVPAGAVRRQVANLRHIRTGLEGEGYTAIHVFDSQAAVDRAFLPLGCTQQAQQQEYPS